MIVSRIQGGLGNQLFQYAAGKALAERLNQPFFIDTRPMRYYQSNPYLLDRFQLTLPEATETNLQQVLGWCQRCTREKTLRLLKPLSRYMVVEKSLGLQQALLEEDYDNAYLVGYWQNARYFESIASILRQALTVPKLSATTQAYVPVVTEAGSVAVHVRRGDYVSNQKVNGLFGVCGLEYYQKAMQHLLAQNQDLHAVVFSNDPQWAKQHVSFPVDTTYIEDQGAEYGHEALMLMRECHYHIIANSTFSWWGAWLSAASGKQICAPHPWYRDVKLATDIIVDDWQRIDSCLV